MRRRRAAAAVVIGALVVAVGAWRWTSTGRVEEETAAPSALASVVATTPEAVPAPTSAPKERPRRRPTPDAPAQRMTTLFRGRAVFDDGRPAVGAKVRVYAAQIESRDADGRIGSQSVVGDDGRFEIVGPEQETGLCVYYGVLPGFAYAGAITSDKDVTLTFVRGGTVTGTVFDAEGKPWPDVAVRLVRCDRVGRVGKPSGGAVWKRPDVAAFYTQSTRTDAAGRFRIGGAPLVTPSDKHCVAIVEGPDGARWRSDVATFETSGGELVRDVRVGAHPFDGSDPLRRIDGRVTDADGGVIEDADVVYGVLDGGTEKERKSDTTDNAGRFVIDLGDDFEADARPVEVRVQRPGYWTWRGAPSKPGEILRVRLTHWAIEPRPGHVLGVAVDSNDRPLSGMLEVNVEDEFFHARRECIVCDEHGAFGVEGLWHGKWRMSLDSGEPVEVVVRDGDEVRVRLRATHESAFFAVKPWTENLIKLRAQLRVRLAELRDRAAKLTASNQPTEVADAELHEAIDRWNRLDAIRLDALPRREVLVTGVPLDGAYVVRAECRGRAWRVEAKDGVARFASLSTETWRFSLERFGIPTAPHDIDIVEGEGAQTVEFSLTK